ncbi:FAD:protein FMN transferase [Sutterella sp.]|uniref:FAD:protein FMN transferase n=1 Tax=Sutterella sp. TaxID=1981025 RepID=UPI0026E07BE3|nr:FAD:protein FMN transferase [Sutterella sp.]MDO5531924.1 FAD:protein FMN transferase [Sutterella sp.]
MLRAILLPLAISLAFSATALPAVSAESAAPAAGQVAAPAEYVLDTATFHMGTLVKAKVFGRTPEETKGFAELMESEVIRYDDMMSVHKETPLNEVNRRAGERVLVTPEIAEMSLEALRIADMTGSAFEPMIGPLVNLWKIGFGGDSVPDDAAIEKAIRLVDHRHVEVTQEGGDWFMRIAAGQNVDMGAIAKGYIGTKLAETLKAAGMTHGLLDLGGNVVAVGEKAAGTPWRIGLQCPDKTRGDFFAIISAVDESVITSGAYERNFEKNGKRYGHILSPVTGRPVATDVASVTIVDRNGARADALCTALFAMRWEKAEAFLVAHPDVHAVILKDDLKETLVSDALRDKIQPYDPELSIRWVSESRHRTESESAGR